MKHVLLFLGISLLPLTIIARQAEKNVRLKIDTTSISSLEKSIHFLAMIEDSSWREKNIRMLYDSLTSLHRIPFAVGDTVVFIYYGKAENISWAGDFNGWNPSENQYCGKQITGSNLWILKKRLPEDARLDYKVVINNNNWILDPGNSYVQWSGFGPNSELRMPSWKYPIETIPLSNIQKGNLSEEKMIYSSSLNYKVQYRIYTPYDYIDAGPLPVAYVTDGHEFADNQEGSMITILDNLIAEKRIAPIIVVFIDPRNPQNPGENRRMQEFTANPHYANFLSDELVPEIDKSYLTLMDADHRMILGTSLGGWNSAYIGITKPEVFHLIGIFSPAFDEHILKKYTDTPLLPLKIYMSTGVIHDTEIKARKMQKILVEKGYSLKYTEVNQGHSWGNWRGSIADLLEYFFPLDVDGN